ncbi:MAG: hypothetical protein RIR25_1419 [Verrucomicrobiota bacterium]
MRLVEKFGWFATPNRHKAEHPGSMVVTICHPGCRPQRLHFLSKLRWNRDFDTRTKTPKIIKV